MFRLDHRVRVFVFQVLEDRVRYLLVRHKPVQEWPFGPVVGGVAVHEHLHDAILREVREETGFRRPLHLLELTHPQKELFGDVGLVEWAYAWQAGSPDRPVGRIEPGPNVGEYAWMGFEEAFQHLEPAHDRDSLIRLQLRLQAG